MRTLGRKISAFAVMGLAVAIQTSFVFGGEEPKIFLNTESMVSRLYDMFKDFTKTPRPLDVPEVKNMTGPIMIGSAPTYLATFRDAPLLDATFGTWGLLSSTRISVARYAKEEQYFPYPYYVIEFPEKSINKIPESIKAALSEFYSVNPQTIDLCTELKTKKGVKNIFVGACSFGPVRERTNGPIVSDFNIIPHGFTRHESKSDSRFNGEIFIGLFESCGVVPGHNSPIKENGLGRQHLRVDSSRSYLDDVLTCQFSEYAEVGSFYILAITPNRENILVTQVLMVNNESQGLYIALAFKNEISFTNSLNILKSSAENYFYRADEQTVMRTAKSLEDLSGNQKSSSFEGFLERECEMCLPHLHSTARLVEQNPPFSRMNYEVPSTGISSSDEDTIGIELTQKDLYGIIDAPKGMENCCPEFFTTKAAEYLDVKIPPFNYRGKKLRNLGKIDLLCAFDHKVGSEHYKHFESYAKFSEYLLKLKSQARIYLLFTTDEGFNESHGHYQLLTYDKSKKDWTIITNPTTQYYLNDLNDSAMVANLMKKAYFSIVDIEREDLDSMQKIIYKERL